MEHSHLSDILLYFLNGYLVSIWLMIKWNVDIQNPNDDDTYFLGMAIFIWPPVFLLLSVESLWEVLVFGFGPISRRRLLPTLEDEFFSR